MIRTVSHCTRRRAGVAEWRKSSWETGSACSQPEEMRVCCAYIIGRDAVCRNGSGGCVCTQRHTDEDHSSKWSLFEVCLEVFGGGGVQTRCDAGLEQRARQVGAGRTQFARIDRVRLEIKEIQGLIQVLIENRLSELEWCDKWRQCCGDALFSRQAEKAGRWAELIGIFSKRIYAKVSRVITIYSLGCERVNVKCLLIRIVLSSYTRVCINENRNNRFKGKGNKYQIVFNADYDQGKGCPRPYRCNKV